MTLSFQTIKNACREVGIVHVSCLSKGQIESAFELEKVRLALWQNAGHAGEMRYMQREPELFCNPERLFPGFKSVVICYVPYLSANDAALCQSVPHGFGRIAKYAMFADYNVVLKNALTQVMGIVLEKVYPQKFRYKVFAGAVPFLAKAAARHSGLGFIGKNLLLNVPGVGSFGFIAEVFLDEELGGTDDTVNNAVDNTGQQRTCSRVCGECSCCIASCPGGALIGDGEQLNAARCVSYLTIEKKTHLNEEEGRRIGDSLFGCDICQDVCPVGKPKNDNQIISSVIFQDKKNASAVYCPKRCFRFKKRHRF